MRAGPHPRALRLDSLRSLAAAAGAFIMERAEYAVELMCSKAASLQLPASSFPRF